MTGYTVTRSAPVAATKTRTFNTTYDNVNCRLLTATNVSETDTNLQLKTTVTYDSYGNTKTVLRDSVNGAADDRKIEVFYDQWGQLGESQTSFIDSLPNPSVSWSTDYKLALLLSTTDVQGQTTTWGYDSFGRVTSESRPDGSNSTITYAQCTAPCSVPNGKQSTEVSGSDGSTQKEYRDSYGRVVGGWAHLPTGQKSRYQEEYDQRGRVAKSYLPWVEGESNFFVDSEYDLIGRLIEEDRPINEVSGNGAITTISYQGLIQTVTNAEGQNTIYETDPLARIKKVTDDLGGVILHEYTVFDQPSRALDPNFAPVIVNYNDRGDRLSIEDRDAGRSTFAYTVFGELKSQTNAMFQTVTMNYNQLGLLESRVEDEGTTSWNYYSSIDYKLWLPSSVSSPGGYSRTFLYDTTSRSTGYTVTIDGVSRTTNIAYHSVGSENGKIKRITYPTSTSGVRLKVDYDYDSWGQLDKVVNGDNPATVFYQLSETDALGRVRLASLGNGIDEDWDYDEANGQLVSILAGPNLTSTIQNLTYDWNKIGILRQRDDNNQTKTEVFTHDGLNRIKTASLNGNTTLTVNYSNTGNIDYKSDVGTYNYPFISNAVTSITGVRPGSYSYDVKGNMKTRDGDAITWYSYDKAKRINYGSDYEEFSYGPNRSRFKRVSFENNVTTTTRTYGRHFEVQDVGGVTTFRHNILVGGQVAAIYSRATSGAVKTNYLHRDHMGGVVVITDDSGGVVENLSFDAFGKRRNADWTADTGDLLFDATHETDRGYTGHEHLDSVRLIHMNGRVQDPITGRMISADPVVPGAFNTQAFNRYSYVVNSPLSLVDPSGYAPALPVYTFCGDPNGCDDGGRNGGGGAGCEVSGLGCRSPGSFSDLDIAEETDRRDIANECSANPSSPVCSQTGQSRMSEVGPITNPFTNLALADVPILSRLLRLADATVAPLVGLGKGLLTGDLDFTPIGLLTGIEPTEGELKTAGIVATLATGPTALIRGAAAKGLTTSGKFFGDKTAKEAGEALGKKFGPPRSSRPGADTFYNPKSGRSYNVHTDPAHGPPHVDIRTRGPIPDRKVPLKGGN